MRHRVVVWFALPNFAEIAVLQRQVRSFAWLSIFLTRVVLDRGDVRSEIVGVPVSWAANPITLYAYELPQTLQPAATAATTLTLPSTPMYVLVCVCVCVF